MPILRFVFRRFWFVSVRAFAETKAKEGGRPEKKKRAPPRLAFIKKKEALVLLRALSFTRPPPLRPCAGTSRRPCKPCSPPTPSAPRTASRWPPSSGTARTAPRGRAWRRRRRCGASPWGRTTSRPTGTRPLFFLFCFVWWSRVCVVVVRVVRGQAHEERKPNADKRRRPPPPADADADDRWRRSALAGTAATAPQRGDLRARADVWPRRRSFATRWSARGGSAAARERERAWRGRERQGFKGDAPLKKWCPAGR